jgi:hypothetical protein
MPEIPALSRLRQKDHEFQDGLGYKVRPCLLKKRSYGNLFSEVYSLTLL